MNILKSYKYILNGLDCANCAKKIEDAILKELEGTDRVFPIYRCTSLEQAVQRARNVAKSGEIVLLSPASASFDMFKDYADRGRKFKEYVNNLK